MEEKNICLTPVQFLQQSEVLRSKAIKDGKFHFQPEYNLCTFALGKNKSAYKCCNCQALYNLAGAENNLLQPFTIENPKSNYYNYKVVVEPWEKSMEALQIECYNRWLVSSCLKKHNINIDDVLLPFMCNGQPYLVQENYRKMDKDFILQACVYYDILQDKGMKIKSFTPILISSPCNYKYKDIKIKSSFTLGVKDVILDNSGTLYDYLLPYKTMIEENYYALWACLCPCEELEEKEWFYYIDKEARVPFDIFA